MKRQEGQPEIDLWRWDVGYLTEVEVYAIIRGRKRM
jgi:hypothetical protein